MHATAETRDALCRLAAEVDSHPAQTADARAIAAYVESRLLALAATLAPPVCPRCQLAQALAPERVGAAN